MLRKKLIIVGSSGHAKVVIDIFEKQGGHVILGLLDPFRKKGEDTCGYKVLGKEEDLPGIAGEHPGVEVFVAVGDNWLRSQVVSKIEGLLPNVSFPSAVHPAAVMGKNVRLGRGTAVMAGAVMNTDAAAGDFCIINTLAGLDHDSVMQAYASLGPRASTGGRVSIGGFTAVSVGATIIHGVSIGAHTVIGAGAVVVKDVGDEAVAYGVPAKVIRNRTVGDKYL